MRKFYLGLSVTYHDPALAIIDAQGQVLYAEATERLLQHKRALNCVPDPLINIPEILHRYCPVPDEIVISSNWLNSRPLYENIVAGLGCLSAKGLLKLGIKRLHSPLENFKLHHMMAAQRNSIKSSGLNLVRMIHEIYPQCICTFADYNHHLTHAAMACFSSPFAQSACAIIDSFGERGAMAFYRYQQGKLHLLHETQGTGSLGLYYMKITELCGFDWIKGEEWKVMGLAPYGKLNQEFYELLQSTIKVDGFSCEHKTHQVMQHIDRLDEFKSQPGSTQSAAADLAYTGQVFFADLLTRILSYLQQMTGLDHLALGGGCALNSSYNGQITRRTGFKQVYIPSAPADDGTALGAAWLSYYRDHSTVCHKPQWLSPYTGSSISNQAIERLLQFNKALKIKHFTQGLFDETAQLLAEGKLVGWIQGRAEFGPRALGNRSILADPRKAETKDLLNQQIKYREAFRPFAPAVLDEYAAEFFEHYQVSPYMDKTLPIVQAKQSDIAAVCHVDGTGRVQTVKQEWNPKFYELIKCFMQKTDIPILLNTSFNIMGKPMVHSLEDVIALFMTSGLDVLVINDYLIRK